MFVVMVVMLGEYVFLLILMDYEVKEFSYISLFIVFSSHPISSKDPSSKIIFLPKREESLKVCM